jgi:hypothetical protein
MRNALFIGLVSLAACSESATAPSAAKGRIIARDSLTANDGNLLPCCTGDSGGAHVTITGGTFTFHAAAQYTDSVATPDGMMSGACVQEVPNGAHIDINGLLTDPDGTSYLLLPCSTGTYIVTLNEVLDYGSGAQRMASVTLSSGTFSWKPNSLTIQDHAGGHGYTAMMSGATITVMGLGHTYQFVALPNR